MTGQMRGNGLRTFPGDHAQITEPGCRGRHRRTKQGSRIGGSWWGQRSYCSGDSPLHGRTDRLGDPRRTGGHGSRALMTNDDSPGVESRVIDPSWTAQTGELAGGGQ